jgi:cold shock CspA family protein
MIGKVASVIERQNYYGKTYKFGFITGEDAKDYYFDVFCLESQYNSMNIFAEGCDVEFDPIVVSEKSNDKALNVHIFNVVEQPASGIQLRA